MDSPFWVDSYPSMERQSAYNLRSSAVSSAVYEALIFLANMTPYKVFLFGNVCA